MKKWIKKILKRRGKDEVDVMMGMLFLVGILAVLSYIFIAVGNITFARTDNPEPIGNSENESSETQMAESGSEENSSTVATIESNGNETETETAQPPANVSTPGTVYDIHALTPERLNEIRSEYSQEVLGFGVDLKHNTGEGNRPVASDDLIARFEKFGVHPTCYCGPPEQKVVAFSFQAGMENGFTAPVLDILAEEGVRGTFYITHEFAIKAPELVKRMINEGHEIGSHSYSCPDEGIAYETLEVQMEDALKMQNYMMDTFQYSIRKYNYNSSMWSAASAVMMTEMGYKIDFCSMNYADYFVDQEYDFGQTLTALQNSLHNGCIYCFHMTNKITKEILPGLINYCKEQGYQIVMVP